MQEEHRQEGEKEDAEGNQKKAERMAQSEEDNEEKTTQNKSQFLEVKQHEKGRQY